jgi:hypothetical protein
MSIMKYTDAKLLLFRVLNIFSPFLHLQWSQRTIFLTLGGSTQMQAQLH